MQKNSKKHKDTSILASNTTDPSFLLHMSYGRVTTDNPNMAMHRDTQRYTAPLPITWLYSSYSIHVVDRRVTDNIGIHRTSASNIALASLSLQSPDQGHKDHKDFPCVAANLLVNWRNPQGKWAMVTAFCPSHINNLISDWNEIWKKGKQIWSKVQGGGSEDSVHGIAC